MERAVEIVKNELISKFKNDPNFDFNSIDKDFWNEFTYALIDFETNAASLYKLVIGKLPQNAESLITELPEIYTVLIEELAEDYVLENSSKAAERLIKNKSVSFEKEVNYVQNLKNAITTMERDSLKQKMNQWEKEI